MVWGKRINNYFDTDRKRAIKESQQKVAKNQIAVILHLFYPDLWAEIKSYLENIVLPYDLYISISAEVSSHHLREITHDHESTFFYEFQNRGRDIGPFMQLLQITAENGYDAICKIHTKKSPHIHAGLNWEYPTGEQWRQFLYNELLGNRDRVALILKTFRENKTVGIIGPKGNLFSYDQFAGGNRDKVRSLLSKMNIQEEEVEDFFGGSMFWFRPDALQLLNNLKINIKDFKTERGSIDGTLAHAMERIFNVSAVKNGYSAHDTENIGGEKK
jgi:rhamnosyltransferase